MRPSTTLIVAVVCLLFTASCATGGDFDCPEGMDTFIELNVYFGQEKGNGETVSEEEWQAFLANAVTPRFPDGLTVLDARGQWFDTDNGRLYRESTKLLNVLVPVDSAQSSVSAVRDLSDIYKKQFDQQAVFYTTSPACAEVY